MLVCREFAMTSSTPILQPTDVCYWLILWVIRPHYVDHNMGGHFGVLCSNVSRIVAVTKINWTVYSRLLQIIAVQIVEMHWGWGQQHSQPIPNLHMQAAHPRCQSCGHTHASQLLPQAGNLVHTSIFAPGCCYHQVVLYIRHWQLGLRYTAVLQLQVRVVHIMIHYIACTVCELQYLEKCTENQCSFHCTYEKAGCHLLCVYRQQNCRRTETESWLK